MFHMTTATGDNTLHASHNSEQFQIAAGPVVYITPLGETYVHVPTYWMDRIDTP